MSTRSLIEVYTDGSATTAEHPGGWAFRIVGNGQPIFESSGQMEKATNNDAELEAAVQGLKFLKEKYDNAGRDPKQEDIYLVSDSQIVLGWASGKFKVKQQAKLEKAKMLRQLVSDMNVIMKWVKGHGTDTHNIRCDKLARNARKGKITKNKPNSIKTMIGTKKKGTVCLWYNNTLKVIDLDSNLVEDYDIDAHGQRSSYLGLNTGEK